MPNYNELPQLNNSGFFALRNDGDRAVLKIDPEWNEVDSEFGTRIRWLVSEVIDGAPSEPKTWDVSTTTSRLICETMKKFNPLEWFFEVKRSGSGMKTTYSILPDHQITKE